MWNALPADVVMTANIDGFKREIDRFWRTDPSMVTSQVSASNVHISEPVKF